MARVLVRLDGGLGVHEAFHELGTAHEDTDKQREFQELLDARNVEDGRLVDPLADIGHGHPGANKAASEFCGRLPL